MNVRRWFSGGAGGLGRRARTWGRHSPLGRSLPRASGRGPLPYIKFYCSSSARAACWKRRQAAPWSETTFPCYLLTWTSSFARDDDAQQERRNGFSAVATMLSLFPSLCVSFCLAAVRGARASRGRRQAVLLFVFPTHRFCGVIWHHCPSPHGLVPGAGTRRWGVLCRGHLAVGLCHILSFTAVAQHAQRAGKEGRRHLGVKL